MAGILSGIPALFFVGLNLVSKSKTAGQRTCRFNS